MTRAAAPYAEPDVGLCCLPDDGPLSGLTEREREILGLMAEGHSNQSICRTLMISPRTVESHVRRVFIKLGLDESPDSCRRVLAVLAFLEM